MRFLEVNHFTMPFEAMIDQFHKMTSPLFVNKNIENVLMDKRKGLLIYSLEVFGNFPLSRFTLSPCVE